MNAAMFRNGNTIEADDDTADVEHKTLTVFDPPHINATGVDDLQVVGAILARGRHITSAHFNHGFNEYAGGFAELVFKLDGRDLPDVDAHGRALLTVSVSFQSAAQVEQLGNLLLQAAKAMREELPHVV